MLVGVVAELCPRLLIIINGYLVDADRKSAIFNVVSWGKVKLA